MAALRLTLRRLTADGSQWATSAAVVPLPGVWTLTLDVAPRAGRRVRHLRPLPGLVTAAALALKGE